MKIALIGGTGFVGRYVAEYLSRDGHHLTLATRQRERHKAAVVHLPGAELVSCNVFDPTELDRLLAGQDAVISMVGILHGSRAAFDKAHVRLVEQLLAGCQRQHIRRIVHISALGASESAPSDYQQTKGKGERLIRESGLDYTILRPSVIFGAGDSFLTLFADLAASLPLLPLAGAQTRFAPVWVEDVARAVSASLLRPETIGRTFDLCGPNSYRLRELVAYAANLAGHPRSLIGLPEGIAMLQAALMECLPGPTLMSRDNVRSLRVDNISPDPFPAEVLGFSPQALETIAPAYLGQREPNRIRDRHREKAARA